MRTCKHLFVYISEVVEFVAAATRCQGEVLVKQGRATVDGKSILGIYSLDLLSPVYIEFDAADEQHLYPIFQGDLK